MRIGDIEKIGDRELPIYTPPAPGAPAPQPAKQPEPKREPVKTPEREKEKV